ncbi:MAG: glycosyltransferase family 4 protein [Thermoplasmata archaeon]|nr:glycosyltransferase family 4 protein [Thermoplasmata archaeon]
MRILVVATNIPYPRECGGSIHVRGVVGELRRRGHEVALCASDGPGLREEPVHGVPVHRFRWRNRDLWPFQAVQRWTHGLRAARIARAFRADVIYERESSLGAGAVAAALLRLPLVVEVNDGWWHRSSLERASRILSITGSSRAVVPERYHHKTAFMHNCVDAAHFDGATPATIPGAEGRPVIGYTGSLLAWHGIEDLATALPMVLEEVPEAAILVAGEGATPEARALLKGLRAAASAAGRPDALLLPGRVAYAEMPGLLAACDVCVAPFDPSREPALAERGFFYSPLKLLDYMAARRPIVSTDIDNVRDMLADGRGILVPPGDPGALAEAVVRLLGDPEERRRMGGLGRTFAEARSYENAGEAYERAILDSASPNGR